MCNDYIDRSITSVEVWKKSGDEIFALKRQTRFAIEEATAKNLVSQTKLRKALENVAPDSFEYKKIDKTLAELRTNWEELNQLYRETSWMEALLWDEDY